MVVLLKPIVAVLLLCVLLMPCVARLSNNNGQYLSDILDIVGEWSDRAQLDTKADLYSKFQRVWNDSWPSIIKLKQDLTVNSPNSADGPYFLSKRCSDDLHRFINGITEFDGWALKMLDASGKFPSGLMLGNMHLLGMYEECIEISSKKSAGQQLNSSNILGKHCLMAIGDKAPMGDLSLGLEFSICIPRTCNSTDAMAMINQVLAEITDDIRATRADCRDDAGIPLDSAAIVVTAILSVFVSLLILGTCLDVVCNHWHQQRTVSTENEQPVDGQASDDREDSLLITNVAAPMKQENLIVRSIDANGCLYRFLIAFSALANAKKILSLQSQQSSRALDSLNGIRFLSMSWIIFGHTYMYAIPVASNIIDYFDWIKGFLFQPFINGTVAVDTFFVLSGTLSAYSLLLQVRALGGLRKVSWLYFYFHRFWRLTPLYMMLLAVWATLIKYMGSGPFWQLETDINCKTSWWTNLLYINNIVHQDSMCMGWSWYLGNDMQFFILIPFFVALLYKWALLGGIVVFVFMLASSTTVGVITYVNDYPPGTPGILQNISTVQQWYKDIYFVPWCRINPYLVGIMVGYILYKTNCNLRIHKALVALGWCFAGGFIISVPYGLYDVANGTYLGPSINALYASLQRTAWGVGVGLVILACATGNGGFVNDLLSLPIMQPLSRLSYGAYLLQQIVIHWYYQNLKVPVFMTHITAIYLFLGHLSLSYIGSFVFSVLIEIPMINLDGSFLRNRKNKD